MKSKWKQCLALGGLLSFAMAMINRLESKKAESRNILEQKGRFFKFRNTNVFYNVRGTGSPVLLVHDLLPQASGYEWSAVRRKLEKEHTVYIVDLPGCGRSEKPMLTYTSYYFVEFITAFIENVIREKTFVVASGQSAFFTILADRMNPELFEKLILVNPERLSVSEQNTDTFRKVIKFLIQLPIFGRFIYNIEMGENNLGNLFRQVYFEKKGNVDQRMVAAYYEAAHKGMGGGRHLLASLRGGFLSANVKNALPELKNLCIIISRERKNSYRIQKEYEKAVSGQIETTQISGSSTLPQLETPDRLAEVIKIFL